MISWRVRQVLFLLIAAFVGYVEGFNYTFWIWNCLPVAVSYILLSKARQKGVNPLPEIAFFVVACGVVLLAHAMWLHEGRSVAVGSSTSGLMFVTLPIYAIVLGAAAFGFVMLFRVRGR
jgi:hypothetical protein